MYHAGVSQTPNSEKRNIIEKEQPSKLKYEAPEAFHAHVAYQARKATIPPNQPTFPMQAFAR